MNKFGISQPKMTPVDSPVTSPFLHAKSVGGLTFPKVASS